MSGAKIMTVSKENMMHHHFHRNYRIISVMFWAFPYLLWQAFGNWSGFVDGVIVAVILTALFNSLFRADNWHAAAAEKQSSSQTIELQTRDQAGYSEEGEPYQRGYRGEERPYRAEPQMDQAGTFQAQYEEMQVPYPEEVMPPMEQRDK
jgi:hypothetical protein